MRQVVGHIKTQLYNKLAAAPFKGRLISDGRNGKPLIGIIRTSQLDDNWTADYHFPKMQAEAVSCRLEMCITAKQLAEAVKEMLDRKYVSRYKAQFNYATSDRVNLNETTLDILRNSEIGQYIAAH
jgi:hypothetical protein